jgi:hyaluronoglucosaminidase
VEPAIYAILEPIRRSTRPARESRRLAARHRRNPLAEPERRKLPMAESPFIHRGIVEGYYGRPWSHVDRRWLIGRMADWGMNTFVYAPKEDPLHREQWRTPYTDDVLAQFRELIVHGAERGVRVGFAIAPGLSIEYASETDRRALLAKLEAFAAIGARFFCLALDDVPSALAHEADRTRFGSLGAAHRDLAHAVKAALPPEATLWLVPTDYAGTAHSPYLATLSDGLDPAIELGWTGRSVLSPQIRTEEAALRAASVGRRLLVWDNFPVADGPMRNCLHVGPYAGRDPDLALHVSGVLLNPMELARASAVGLAAAAAYLRAPDAYEAESAWTESLHAAGVGADSAFAVFSAAHRFSPLSPDERDPELERIVHTLKRAFEHGADDDAASALAALRAAVEERRAAATTIREGLVDRALAAELEPWLESHQTETCILVEAVDLLARLVERAPAMKLALALFRMQGRLTRIAPAKRTSYGPRRVIHPQLASLEDESARFSTDPVLFLDRCLSDELVRFAESHALARLGGRAVRAADG